MTLTFALPDDLAEAIRERKKACPRATESRVLDAAAEKLAPELGGYPTL